MITASHTQFEPFGSFCGYDSLYKVTFQPYGNALLLPHKYRMGISLIMTRYEYQIVLKFEMNDKEKLPDVLRVLEAKHFFFGDNSIIEDEDYDGDYYTPKNSKEETITYTMMLDNKPLFTCEYLATMNEYLDQILHNDWNAFIEENRITRNKISEPNYPDFAFLYLTDGEDYDTDTITGEDNKTLNVHYTTWNWDSEFRITFDIDWYTDSKKSPAEIEDTMKNYFIAEIKHIQNTICEAFDVCEFADTDNFTLDCQFKAYSHYEQKCSPEVREQLRNKLGE